MNTTAATPQVSSTLNTVVELTDWDTMVKLVQTYGGTRIHFPPYCNVSPTHAIAMILGEDNLRKLARYFDGDTIYIPHTALNKTIRDQQIYADASQGNLSYNELARKYRVSDRWIRHIISQGEKTHLRIRDTRQPSLFDD